jgi:hypothetical protein
VGKAWARGHPQTATTPRLVLTREQLQKARAANSRKLCRDLVMKGSPVRIRASASLRKPDSAIRLARFRPVRFGSETFPGRVAGATCGPAGQTAILASDAAGTSRLSALYGRVQLPRRRSDARGGRRRGGVASGGSGGAARGSDGVSGARRHTRWDARPSGEFCRASDRDLEDPTGWRPSCRNRTHPHPWQGRAESSRGRRSVP